MDQIGYPTYDTITPIWIMYFIKKNKGLSGFFLKYINYYSWHNMIDRRGGNAGTNSASLWSSLWSSVSSNTTRHWYIEGVDAKEVSSKAQPWTNRWNCNNQYGRRRRRVNEQRRVVVVANNGTADRFAEWHGDEYQHCQHCQQRCCWCGND